MEKVQKKKLVSQQIKKQQKYIKIFKNCITIQEIKQNFLKSKRQNLILKQETDTKNIIKDKMDITCSICFDLIIASCTTVCGHTFCENCIQESLIRIPFCPICRTNIRSQIFCYSKQLDNLINKFVDQLKSENLKEHVQFQLRLKEHQYYKEKCKIKNFSIQQKVDIRDQDYIWCKGTVIKIFYKQINVASQVLIRYDKIDTQQDEFIPVNSLRLAPLGIFTSRTDIPQYMNQQNNISSYLLNLIFNENNESQRNRDYERIQIIFQTSDDRRGRQLFVNRSEPNANLPIQPLENPQPLENTQSINNILFEQLNQFPSDIQNLNNQEEEQFFNFNPFNNPR